MKRLNAVVVAGEITEDGGIEVTVKTPDKHAGVTMGANVAVIDYPGDVLMSDLNELHDYLIDRPALMDDKVVKDGVFALRKLLGIY